MMLPSPSSTARTIAGGALMLLGLLQGCGVSHEDLEGFQIVRTPVSDCTRNASSSVCVPPEDLAAQRVVGRWIIEHSPGSTFSLTTEEGTSITGVTFDDDGELTNLEQILPGQPCRGTGGLCYFARHRFESTNDQDNGCTRFGQLAVLLSRQADGTFLGRVGNIQGTDEDCGTSTVVERVEDVTGTLAASPALARTEEAR